MFAKTRPVTFKLRLCFFAIILLELSLGILISSLPIQAAAIEGLDQVVTTSTSLRDHQVNDTIYSTGTITHYVYLPVVSKPKGECLPIAGADYGSLAIPNWVEPERLAELHGDLNLALRGYSSTIAYLGLIDVGGPEDKNAPQLAGLFAVPHAPTFTTAYRVNNWDWDCDCRGDPITDPEVTLADLAASPTETVHVPPSGYEIGGGYEVLVLYASAERLTLKYTSEDNVIWGYTLHLENICVDPNLLALYQTLDSAGRHALPALRAGQALGRVRASGTIGVAIRDSGAFMDPRVRKDWWLGY